MERTITIKNFNGSEDVLPIVDMSCHDDVAHFIATYNRALRHAGEGKTVTIILGERTVPKFATDGEGNQRCYDEGGWLEHTILCQYEDGGKLHIGAIQRKPGERSEFHS